MFEDDFAKETVVIKGRTYVVSEPDWALLMVDRKEDVGGAAAILDAIYKSVTVDGQPIPQGTKIPVSIVTKLAPVVMRVAGTSEGNDQ